MQVIEIKNKEKWNKFVAENGSQFLQSWEWAEFQRSVGRKTWVLGVEANSDKMVETRKHTNEDTKTHEIVCGALVVKYDLPLDKSYLYLPRGPVVLVNSHQSIVISLLEKIKEIAKEEKAIFIRFEPINDNILKILNLKSSTFAEASVDRKILNQIKPIQPKDEWRLDLSPSEEELLQAMRPKTRYNIGLALRHGVKIREGDKEKDFPNFWRLISETYKKKGLRTHPRNYYYQMLKLKSVKLYLAEYQGKILTANILVFFGDRVYYLHGGSSDENKNLMAPYLLFWETIREAKRLGYKYYNFGAVVPAGSDENHPWVGITRFKKGFGGEEVNYAGTFDLPVSRFWYKLYKFAKIITNFTRIGRK